MSFDFVCESCGAPSSPSTGICPYCKSRFSKSDKEVPAVTSIKELYAAGRYVEALAAAEFVEKKNSEESSKSEFVLLYVQILLDCDAPIYKMQSLLNVLLMQEPQNKAAREYLDIVQANSALRPGCVDPGEIALRKVLSDSPNNVHALFLLGAHLFWEENNLVESARLMEKCVMLRPNMKRSWGCLAALYKKQGNKVLQKKAAEKFLSLETSPKIRQFITSEFL